MYEFDVFYEDVSGYDVACETTYENKQKQILLVEI